MSVFGIISAILISKRKGGTNAWYNKKKAET
jgi:hypothetical protein